MGVLNTGGVYKFHNFLLNWQLCGVTKGVTYVFSSEKLCLPVKFMFRQWSTPPVPHMFPPCEKLPTQ